MKYKVVLAVLLGALVAPAAFAGDDIDVSGLIQPGLYEVTAQVSVKDIGELPPSTRKICVSEDKLKNFAKDMAEKMKQSNANVTLKDLSLNGKTLHLALEAPQGNLTVETVFDDPTHYHQTMNGVMAGRAMTMHSKAHRVGECKKAPAESGS